MTSEERKIILEMVRAMLSLARAVGRKADTGDSIKDEEANKSLNDAMESLNKAVVLMGKTWSDK